MKRLAAALVVAALSAVGYAQSPPPEMTTYAFVMLVKGPRWEPGPKPELMKGHMEHLTRVYKAGKTVIGGPLTDNGTIRGLVVYKTGVEEARALASEDPAVKAGHFAVEAHPWMVQKGILP